MSTKAVNRVFLISLLVEMAVILYISVTETKLGAVASVVVTQLIMFIPVACGLLLTKTKPGFIAHKKMHFVTPLLCLVYAGLCMPLIMVVNMISMFFVKNTANQLAYQMINVPWWLMFLIVGILGPMNEEFICRGVYYHSYKGSGRMMAAMFMSAFLFGLMHLNFNQMSYAMVVGVLAVILLEATGNIASTIIFHAAFNSYNVVVMLLQRDRLAASGGDSQAMVDSVISQMGMSYQQFLIMGIAIYSVIAIFTTTLAILLTFGIAHIEKRTADLKGLFRKKEAAEKQEKKKSLWTWELVAGVVICFVYMFLVK